MRVQGLSSALVVISLSSSLVACVPESTAGNSGPRATGRVAMYNCSDASSLRIERLVGAVRLVDPDGETVDLPAAPAGQDSRYGEQPYALVLDGKEALLMKNGREPLTCTQ